MHPLYPLYQTSIILLIFSPLSANYPLHALCHTSIIHYPSNIQSIEHQLSIASSVKYSLRPLIVNYPLSIASIGCQLSIIHYIHYPLHPKSQVSTIHYPSNTHHFHSVIASVIHCID